jgi:hypothetical protein
MIKKGSMFFFTCLLFLTIFIEKTENLYYQQKDHLKLAKWEKYSFSSNYCSIFRHFKQDYNETFSCLILRIAAFT